MDSTQNIIKEASKSSGRLVLATIIRIDGAAYRKEGAMMLFGENGLQMGMISGGCLEEDLEQKASALMENPKIRAQTARYDMRSEDDLGWGRGTGCNGIVHILIEKVDDGMQANLQQIQEHLNARKNVSLIKEIIPIESTHKDPHENDIKNVLIHTKIIPNQGELPKAPFLKSNSNNQPDLKKNTQQNFFAQEIRPKPRLIIFGAGIDVRPVVALAHQTGFSVTVWDWRASLLKQSLFPNTVLIHTASIKEAILQTGIAKSDYVIIMTHDFQMDSEIMHHLLQMEGLQYLGILGPRRRTRRLLQQPLNRKIKNFSRQIPKHVHSPVGLPIGADGPDEIAISILADLILAKQGKSNEKRTFIENMQSSRNLFSSGK